MSFPWCVLVFNTENRLKVMLRFQGQFVTKESNYYPLHSREKGLFFFKESSKVDTYLPYRISLPGYY